MSLICLNKNHKIKQIIWIVDSVQLRFGDSCSANLPCETKHERTPVIPQNSTNGCLACFPTESRPHHSSSLSSSHQEVFSWFQLISLSRAQALEDIPLVDFREGSNKASYAPSHCYVVQVYVDLNYTV